MPARGGPKEGAAAAALIPCALPACATHARLLQGASRLLSQRMAEELMNMPLEEAMPLTRALGHYLNLTSIAELHHRWAQRGRLGWLCGGAAPEVGV
jgi:hypothetical protein